MLLLVPLAPQCTRERLEPPREEPRAAVDNLITVDGDFCTRRPDPGVFPVKILLIMDSSGSLQFTDEGGLRVSAVKQLLSRFQGDVSVSFNLIQFNSFVKSFPEDKSFNNVVPVTDAQLQVADVQTSYQAALGRAYETLLLDMTKSGAVVLNTKYVVIFFSDGSPSPVCCPCSDETTTLDGTDHFTCDAEGNPDPPPPVVVVGGIDYPQRFCEGTAEIPFCNLPLDRSGANAGAYPELDVNGSYDRGYQIAQKVHDMVDLAATFDVGQFQFHTVFLNNPNLPDAIRQIIGVNEVTSRARMENMAAIGGGNFIEARNPQELNFLQFDFTAIKRAFGLRRMLVTNLNAVPGRTGPLVDSDGDGLSDDEEQRGGLTNFLKKDSDGDGYGDLLEVRLKDRGMDPVDPNVPFEPCADSSDLDHDLLTACEERFLNTDPEQPDSDHDTIPDGLELRFGLDPNTADADLDYDFDGVSNGEEVNRGTNPLLDDPVARDRASVRYRLEGAGETADRRACFAYTSRNIQLQYTQGRDGLGAPGWNDIYVWEIESPESNTAGATWSRVACLRARYLPPDFKDPETGHYARLRDEDLKGFDDPAALAHCFGPELGASP